ncbi:plastin-3-like [Gigantopelta aegis]|uniref:plastin-3-like n=1 Tax=Gigantopelta aegis TaxID=1735272 RepID=UPI001B889115|nr:plastin-3-like [Gigantopelta aegis]XP_041365895.1 plastin-3-like [Gigantopelta aegis]
MADQSVELTDEQKEELANIFGTIDVDGNGFIALDELGAALECCGIKHPGYYVRDLITKYDKSNDGKLDMSEFAELYRQEKQKVDMGLMFKKHVSKATKVKHTGGTSEVSSAGTTHMIKEGEEVAFTDWINKNLDDDPDCKKYLPLDLEGQALYRNVGDGIIFCKLINQAAPNTIDERTINKSNLSVYKKHENLMLALNSASSIGCSIVNIGADDLHQGKPHLVLGLLWQIIRIGLLSDIDLQHHPGLVRLLMEGETIEDLRKLSPEQILLRWVNYHLANAPETDRQISNFSEDIKDSEAYTYLLHQIAPREKGVHTNAMVEQELESRAELMLQESEKLDCRSFIGPKDVVKGNQKLNLAFVANLFNNYPALEKPDDYAEMDIIEETREEKTYRNWMNSLGVKPFVSYLYSDLQDGLIIFQLFEIIKPGSVNWSRVIQKFSKIKANFQKLENCNYAVELAKAFGFSLVGIGGTDILEGNPTLTLALIWQLMRAYTLHILAKLAAGGDKTMILEQDILEWANTMLAGKSKINSFSDPNLSDGVIILNLIDKLKPGCVNFDLVKKATTVEDKQKNAKYAINLSWKLGARVYALPEDIVESKPKMIMTMFACLMTRDPKYMGNNMTGGLTK